VNFNKISRWRLGGSLDTLSAFYLANDTRRLLFFNSRRITFLRNKMQSKKERKQINFLLWRIQSLYYLFIYYLCYLYSIFHYYYFWWLKIVISRLKAIFPSVSKCSLTMDGYICRLHIQLVHSQPPDPENRRLWCDPIHSMIATTVQCESKNPPWNLLTFFPKRLGIFSPNFTCLLYVPNYAGLKIFIQLSATLTKLCHIKRGHGPP